MARKCLINNCDSNVHARNLCGKHYRRWNTHGDPEKTAWGTLKERFDKKLYVTPGCWIWLGSMNKQGYGQIYNKGKNELAHRTSYRLHKGAIPEGMFVLHKCDNPACVNPDHLFIGTQLDNMDDMGIKGRRKILKGESHYCAKLTENSVIEIYKSNNPHKVLAEKYGVAVSTVGNIKSGETWKHVTEAFSG